MFLWSRRQAACIAYYFAFGLEHSWCLGHTLIRLGCSHRRGKVLYGQILRRMSPDIFCASVKLAHLPFIRNHIFFSRGEFRMEATSISVQANRGQFEHFIPHQGSCSREGFSWKSSSSSRSAWPVCIHLDPPVVVTGGRWEASHKPDGA